MRDRLALARAVLDGSARPDDVTELARLTLRDGDRAALIASVVWSCAALERDELLVVAGVARSLDGGRNLVGEPLRSTVKS